jgi:hypothetical protein
VNAYKIIVGKPEFERPCHKWTEDSKGAATAKCGRNNLFHILRIYLFFLNTAVFSFGHPCERPGLNNIHKNSKTSSN